MAKRQTCTLRQKTAPRFLCIHNSSVGKVYYRRGTEQPKKAQECKVRRENQEEASASESSVSLHCPSSFLYFFLTNCSGSLSPQFSFFTFPKSSNMKNICSQRLSLHKTISFSFFFLSVQHRQLQIASAIFPSANQRH